MNHEGREGREGVPGWSGGLRVNSPLDAATEAVVRRTIGCAIEVHRRLGPGFLEGIYRQAMCVELEGAGVAYECERRIEVGYRGRRLSGQRVDLIVADVVIVELKTITKFDEVHFAQLLSYLKTTGVRAGLLINFRVPVLTRGLRRVVL